MRLPNLILLAGLALPVPFLSAEPCVTQSQMKDTDRTALLQAATGLASRTANGDADGIRSQTMPQFAKDFDGIAQAIRNAAPHLQGASFVPETVWILDNSAAKAGADGTPQDAQFFCTLNHGTSETSFLIPALPPGRYGFAVLNTAGTAEPWQVSLLLRESAPGGSWQLGGLFPRATTAGGHDGLWYWRAAREFAAKKQSWNAWVYYIEAETLLRPASFLSSSHLDMLGDERTKAAPPALAAGLSSTQPLVIAGPKGTEVRVTGLSAENAPGKTDGIDLLVHVHADEAIPDPVAARARNAAAAKAIIAAHPELRTGFHGVWVVADLPGGTNFVSEEPMNSL